jgi:hypothetical protein
LRVWKVKKGAGTGQVGRGDSADCRAQAQKMYVEGFLHELGKQMIGILSSPALAVAPEWFEEARIYVMRSCCFSTSIFGDAVLRIGTKAEKGKVVQSSISFQTLCVR